MVTASRKAIPGPGKTTQGHFRQSSVERGYLVAVTWSIRGDCRVIVVVTWVYMVLTGRLPRWHTVTVTYIPQLPRIPRNCHEIATPHPRGRGGGGTPYMVCIGDVPHVGPPFLHRSSVRSHIIFLV